MITIRTPGPVIVTTDRAKNLDTGIGLTRKEIIPPPDWDMVLLR